MAYETLLIESKDQITTITLNRPKSKNAMNPQMHFDMCDALAGVESDDDCRVLVITGAGDSFCAGMDVKEYFYDTEEKPAERAAARKAAFELYEEEAAKNPAFKKIYVEWKKFRDLSIQWFKVAEASYANFLYSGK